MKNKPYNPYKEMVKGLFVSTIVMGIIALAYIYQIELLNLWN